METLTMETPTMENLYRINIVLHVKSLDFNTAKIYILSLNDMGYTPLEKTLVDDMTIEDVICSMFEQYIDLNSSWILKSLQCVSVAKDISNINTYNIHYGVVIPHDTPLKNDIQWLRYQHTQQFTDENLTKAISKICVSEYR